MSSPSGRNLGDSSSSTSIAEDKLLLEPFTYLEKVPGKDIRKQLIDAFNVWLKVPNDELEKIGEIVQMLHNASLLIDDIEDNSVLRRGVPVAHKIYGVPITINAGNYVMFIALQKVLDLATSSSSKSEGGERGNNNKKVEEAVRIFTEQMLELHRGQGMEIYWRDNFTCPSDEEYRAMTVRKTGGLFNLAVRLMQLFSPTNSAPSSATNASAKDGDSNNHHHKHKEDFVALNSLLGLYFQVRDDYANLCLEKYEQNKSYAEDLTEGKFSFPIIHAINTNTEFGQQVTHILRQRTTSVEVKKHCVTLLRDAGSFDYTKSVLRRLDAKAREEIERLGGNELLVNVMDFLKDWDRD